jgi:DNA-binding transcriptional MocR family regulator
VLEDGGMEAHLDELRAVYSARVRTLDAALQDHLPEISYHFPQGGYFFWVRLPDGRNAEELLSDAVKFKVSFKPGIRFSSQDGQCDHMRLCFAYYEAEALVQGVERLKRAMRR